jgi:AcrR family transcriptional regulator
VSDVTAESPRRMPGRPRSEASHQAIIRATLELLLEVGYGPLTMEAVRLRAGVGKATIYRRWSSKEELVRDAIVALHEEFDVPDTGSLRGDYHAIAEMVRASCTRSSTRTSSSRGARRSAACSAARWSAARSATTSTSSC